MISSTFFFELYTEEIPFAYQVKAISHVKDKLSSLLVENKLPYKSFDVGGTYRRIFISILSLSENQERWKEKKKGPPRKFCYTDQKEKSPQLLGFAKRLGVNVKEIKFESDSDEAYSFIVQTMGGANSLKILGQKLPNLFLGIPFEKTMRWGDKKTLYARPIIQYVCYYNAQHQIFEKTHYFWEEVSPSDKVILDPIVRKKAKISGAEHYFELLKKQGITVKEKERLKLLKESLLHQAKKENCELVLDSSLLEEVNFLVEQPKVLTGEFSDNFLKLPEIIITTEMQKHQKYFPLKDKNGRISNKFLIVANVHSKVKESLANICLGNKRVLASRLSDGVFFFQEDRKKSLIDYVENLKHVTYQEKIGNMFDKKERIKKLAIIILNKSSLSIDENINYKRACDLLKADITTNLVYEFDSLQGDIGSIYARLDGEPSEIYLAIYEHYLPRFRGDVYPVSPLGILLSFCDKFDNLICSFLLDKEPTASHDPLGVRRQTIYIIEMMIKYEVELPMLSFLETALNIYKNVINQQQLYFKDICNKIWNFIRGRFVNIFEKKGFDKKIIRAALFTLGDDVCRLYTKISALSRLMDRDSFADIMSAFVRMNNILKEYQQKNKDFSIQPKIDKVLFLQNEESSLYQFAENLRSMMLSIHSKKNYEEVFLMLASSRVIVDLFFDRVLVMHEKEKIRINRFSLLQHTVEPIKELFNLDLLK